MIPFNPKTVRPHQLGWLHRSEMDHLANGHKVWELPNGALHVQRNKDGEPALVVMPKGWMLREAKET